LHKWISKLRYDFIVEYKTRIKNKMVDALLRKDEEKPEGELSIIVVSII